MMTTPLGLLQQAFDEMDERQKAERRDGNTGKAIGLIEGMEIIESIQKEYMDAIQKGQHIDAPISRDD